MIAFSNAYFHNGQIMAPVLSIKQLNKQYKSGLHALTDVSLDIESGQIFALLGPNGAGKTTLISILCGLTTLSSGTVTVHGKDILQAARHVRPLIGLVPQE